MSEEGGGGQEGEGAFSFMDKVRFMMYGEQEKEAFLIEKKEKEEKKKAKLLEKQRRQQEGEGASEKSLTVFGKIKAFVSGSAPSPDEDHREAARDSEQVSEKSERPSDASD